MNNHETTPQPDPQNPDMQSLLPEQSGQNLDHQPVPGQGLAELPTPDAPTFDQLLDAHFDNQDRLERAERGKERAARVRRVGLGVTLSALTLNVLGVVDPSLPVDEFIDPTKYLYAGNGIMLAGGFKEAWSNRKVRHLEKRQKQINRQIDES